MVACLGKFAKTFRRKLKILKFLISENFSLRWTIANLTFCDRELSYVNLKCQLQGFCNLRLNFFDFYNLYCRFYKWNFSSLVERNFGIRHLQYYLYCGSPFLIENPCYDHHAFALSFSLNQILHFQKQPSRGVLRKRCSENMQPIDRRIPMSKCCFNHTSAWVFSCKFAERKRPAVWTVLQTLVVELFFKE